MNSSNERKEPEKYKMQKLNKKKDATVTKGFPLLKTPYVEDSNRVAKKAIIEKELSYNIILFRVSLKLGSSW